MSTDYLPHKTMELDTVVKRVKKALWGYKGKFNSILCSGISGISVSSVVAHDWDKQLVVIRKARENSHGNPVEGDVTGSYIIIDDFPVSGATIERILSTQWLAKKLPVAVVFYGSARTSTSFTWHDWNGPYGDLTPTQEKRVPFFRKRDYLYVPGKIVTNP